MKVKSATILLIIMIMTLLVKHNVMANNVIKLKEENIKIIENRNEQLKEELIKTKQELSKLNQEKIQWDNFKEKYELYDIPLDIETQIYANDLCEENELDVKLLYSVIQLESNFQPDLISSTGDLGLNQINKNYIEWYAELANLENYNPFDVKDSIAMGVAGLIYYRDYWINQGITDEETLMIYTLNTYNMGFNYKNYIKDTGKINRSYDILIAQNYSNLTSLSKNSPPLR